MQDLLLLALDINVEGIRVEIVNSQKCVDIVWDCYTATMLFVQVMAIHSYYDYQTMTRYKYISMSIHTKKPWHTYVVFDLKMLYFILYSTAFAQKRLSDVNKENNSGLFVLAVQCILTYLNLAYPKLFKSAHAKIVKGRHTHVLLE